MSPNIQKAIPFLLGLLFGGIVGYAIHTPPEPATKSDLQASTAQINQQIQQAQSQLSTLNQNIASVNQNTQNLDYRLARVENAVSGIDTKISNTNTAMNNLLIYSITLAVVFSLAFNLSWKLLANKFQIKNDFGGLAAGFSHFSDCFYVATNFLNGTTSDLI